MANRSPTEIGNTCSVWATTDDFCGSCGTDEFIDALDSDLADRMLQAASNILYRLTARQFPGLCESTIRPCSKPRLYTLPTRYTSEYTYVGWLNSCGCWPRGCGCRGLSEILLSPTVVSVDEVIVDGVTLDSADYRIDDYHKLVRLDGERWPCCPNLSVDATEAGSFQITYSHGAEPPAEGVHAAAVLACELILACNGSSECRLPRRVQSVTRQGVSMVVLDPLDFFDQGRTGLAEVDLFIKSVNPKGRQRNSGVYSPDINPRFRKVNTGQSGS